MREPLRPALLAAALCAATPGLFAFANPIYLDPGQPQEARIHDLIGRMTLEEKASLMENTTPGVPRLGIPRYNWWSEALHGVANAGYATVFPQAIGMAAMWDDRLQTRIGHVVGVEGRAKYNGYAGTAVQGTMFHGLTFWSPNINIFRDPRWGRGQETYGEDPFLTSRLGVAYVRGLQGDDPRYLLVGACGKHFAVHSGPESLRHIIDVSPPEADLYETYFPSFEALVRESHVEIIMTAYNSLYGTPCSMNPLLYSRLAQWGFDGHVTSDCGSVGDLRHTYHRAADDAEAEALVLKAGLNTTCGFEAPGIVEAVHRGLLSPALVDRRVAPLLRTMFRLGFFDPKDRDPYNAIAPGENDTPAHAALALQAARESIVLLKNNGLLPLRKGAYSRIAVIGPNANSIPALVGNYNGTPSRPITLLDGIKAALGPDTKIEYAHGPDYAAVPDGERLITGTWFHAEYFPNRDLRGKGIERGDRPIDFDYAKASLPDKRLPAGVPDRDFSVRWTGSVMTTVPGDYRFVVRARGGFRLMVDGKTLIDSWNPAGANPDREREIAVTRHLADNASVALRVEYACGREPGLISLRWATPPADADVAHALEVARRADLIVYVGGISAEVEGEEMQVPYEGFSGGDRLRIELPALQERLLRQLKALGKPLVYVNMSGSAIAMPWADEHVDAIVQAFYPGEAGGRAVADVLFGDYNPAGRLPITFYRSTDDLPAFTDYRMQNRTYRYFRGKPLYPFGYGLSFTHFAYTHLHASSAAGGGLIVWVDVTNTGDRNGDEVVQLYATPPAASSPRESEALCGFRRIFLAAKETKTVRIDVTPFALRRWNGATHAYGIPAGAWTMRAGASSADIRETLVFGEN